jgi:protocatechuate 3,4-dioxygenase beta subunit
MDAIDRHQTGPWWQPSTIDIDRRRALVGLSGLVMAAMSSTRAWAALDSRVALAPFDARALAQGRQGGQTPGSCVLTPEAGEGPFYLDPKLIRADITSKQPGAPLQLALQVVRAGDCATLANARVDVWQADALGLYSGYERQSGVGGISTKSAIGQQYLRGTQFTDPAGNVQFRTIFPSWYGGRTPHVHFKVFLGGNEVVASQVFFPDEISKEIFSSVEPYRQHASKRSTFNSNDPIKQGVYSQVTRQSGVYAARAVLVVAAK